MASAPSQPETPASVFVGRLETAFSEKKLPFRFDLVPQLMQDYNDPDRRVQLAKKINALGLNFGDLDPQQQLGTIVNSPLDKQILSPTSVPEARQVFISPREYFEQSMAVYRAKKELPREGCYTEIHFSDDNKVYICPDRWGERFHYASNGGSHSFFDNTRLDSRNFQLPKFSSSTLRAKGNVVVNEGQNGRPNNTILIINWLKTNDVQTREEHSTGDVAHQILKSSGEIGINEVRYLKNPGIVETSNVYGNGECWTYLNNIYGERVINGGVFELEYHDDEPTFDLKSRISNDRTCRICAAQTNAPMHQYAYNYLAELKGIPSDISVLHDMIDISQIREKGFQITCNGKDMRVMLRHSVDRDNKSIRLEIYTSGIDLTREDIHNFELDVNKTYLDRILKSWNNSFGDPREYVVEVVSNLSSSNIFDLKGKKFSSTKGNELVVEDSERLGTYSTRRRLNQ